MMLYEELFIDGKIVDIKGVEIERTYETPFFSDITKILSDSTKTIKLPETERNKAVMEYLHLADMNTDFPYTFHYADYYLNGMQLIKNGEVKVLGDFEIQIVYGVNRAKYLPLKETKLNEIEPNGTTILESDWVVNWDLTHMYATNKKYKYLEYINRELTTDIITIGGVSSPPAVADEPMLSNLDAMSSHPFIKFNDMLDLINHKNAESNTFNLVVNANPLPNKLVFSTEIQSVLEIGDLLEELNGDPLGFSATIVSFDDDHTAVFSGDVSEFFLTGTIAKITGYRNIFNFEPLKERLANKGLILGGKKDNYIFEKTHNYAEYAPELSNNLYLGSTIHSGIVNISNYNISTIRGAGGKFTANVVIDLDFSIDNYISGLSLYRSYFDTETSTTIAEIVKTIPFVSNPEGWLVYLTSVEFEVSSDDDKDYSYYIKFNQIEATGYSFEAGAKIKISYSINESVFRYLDYYGNSFGRYNCLINLPNMTQIDFITQMLAITGMVVTYDEGYILFKSLDNLKNNYINSNILDWSGKVSRIKNSKYNFNQNSQKNRLVFNNSNSVNFTGIDYLSVDDKTLLPERDLIKIDFNLPDKNVNGQAEFILYSQTITTDGKSPEETKTFKNEYSEKESVCVFDSNGIAIVGISAPMSFSGTKLKTILATRSSDFVIDISDYFEPSTFMPEAGSKVVSIDGNLLNDVFVTKRDGYLITLNQNIITDINEHFVVFDDSYTGFVAQYYQTYQKLINRSIIKEVDVLLDFYESSQIDFTKPIYIKEWGKYCMLLELNASNKGLSKAKLLLINQTL